MARPDCHGDFAEMIHSTLLSLPDSLALLTHRNLLRSLLKMEIVTQEVQGGASESPPLTSSLVVSRLPKQMAL
jgi:hypothetical protein